MVAGFGDVGKGSAASLRKPAAASWSPRSIRSARCRRRWKATRSRPWRMRRRAPTSSSPPPAMSTSSPSTTCAQMKHRAIVCNIGHFDSEIQVAALQELQVAQRQAAGGRDRIPRRQAHHPAFRRPPGESRQRHGPSRASSCRRPSPTRRWRRSSSGPIRGKYEKKVYTLPKHLDEKVARAASRKDRRQADQADRQAGDLYRRAAGRPVQAGSLSVLRRLISVRNVSGHFRFAAGVR